ncbi:unnamed protein product, partial [marine sediment metagenome]
MKMSPFARWVVASILVFVHIAAASAEERLWLAADGKALATIVGGGEDDFAAERLRRWFAEKANVEVSIAPAEEGRLPGEGCAILLGSLDSNPLIRTVAKQLGLKLDPAELTDQGT